MAPKRGKKDDSVSASKKKTSASSARVKESPSPNQRITRSLAAASVPPLDSLPERQPRKKAKKASEEEEVKPEETLTAGENVQVSKKIVIEHCKQCNSIKTRAMQVKSGLEESIPGIKVLVNPEKPRYGCFEIREEDGEAFLTLLSMKRPFKELKALDMDEVVSDIVKKLK